MSEFDRWLGASLLFLSLALLPSLVFGQTQDDIDESQVFYAEARILENQQRHLDALGPAKQAIELNPNSAQAAELLIQLAAELGDQDLGVKQKTNLDRIRKAEATQFELDQQLALADERMEQGNCSDALAVLERLPLGGQAGGLAQDLQTQDIYFRMAVCHMNLGENGKFEKEMRAAGREFYQRGQFLRGQYFALEGFFGAAINAYSAAAQRPKNNQYPWDAQLAKQAQQRIEALKKTNLHFLFSMFGYSDSNPFGLPSGLGLSDDTTNYANYMSATVVAGFDKLLNAVPRLSYGVFVNGSQNFSFAGDGRQILNVRALGASAQARYGIPGVGRFGPRYEYSGVNSPVAILSSTNVNSYETRSIAETHTFSFDFSKRLKSYLETLISYSYAFEQFTTPEDFDIFDRSGSRQSLSWIAMLLTGKPLFQPAWSLYGEKKQALGIAENSLAYGSTLQNVARFGRNSALELQTNVSYEYRAYADYPGGRVDRTSRFAAALTEYLSPRFSMIGNAAYSVVSSNVDYYTQSRWLFSLGFRYGF